MDTSLTTTTENTEAHNFSIIDADNSFQLTADVMITVPALFADAGTSAMFRFAEFFNAKQRNQNTRLAYARAVLKFCSWSELQGLELSQINPLVLAQYFDQLLESHAITTVKQHHSALSKFFDWMVQGHIFPVNPMYSVEAPKYTQDKGKTPVMSESQARHLLDSIDTTKIAGKRDKAILAVMLYSFARVSAVINMKVEDYFFDGESMVVRLIEKGSKYMEMPLNHKAIRILNDYIEDADISEDKKQPLFRALNRSRNLTDQPLDRRDCWRMVKRRVKNAGLSDKITNHSCRASGITSFLLNGGLMEDAQFLAGHADIKTTRLYDRREKEATVAMVELVGI